MNRIAPQDSDIAWHAMDVDDVIEKVGAHEEGLSSDVAKERLEEYGPNKLPEEKREGPVMRLLRQFHNVLIYVLLGAAVITALLDHWIDTGVILAVVVVNALIGFIQEGKAEHALEGIRKMLSLKANVLRDGRRMELPAEEIVPGDIVILQSGDRVPADLRLIKVNSLHIDESALTGESEPVEMTTRPEEEDTLLGDRTNMAYSSTLVTYGKGRGVVIGSGANTEIGRIGEMISGVEKLTTPLLKKIEQFGKLLSVFIIALGAGTFVFAYFLRDYAIEDLFMIVVGLAVAAIPEGLPAIMTITLAIGVQTMAHRNAIIRRLPAVETLGSVTVICSDKTGTLTRNEMTVTRILTASDLFEVTGTGYAPEGSFELNGEEIDVEDHSVIGQMALAGLLSSDSEVVQNDEGQWELRGEPTEGAVITLALKAGLNQTDVSRENRRIDFIPFESQNQYMASLNEAEGGCRIFVKGAPERLLEFAEKQAGADGDEPLDHDFWDEQMKKLAGGGHRLLAVAEKEVDDRKDKLGPDDAEGGLTLLGVFGLIDPPRAEAIAAIEECKNAGIEVKMITGDHAVTAAAIAKVLGLDGGGDGAVTGRDLEKSSDEELVDISTASNVFARTSPEHKLRLVQALQKKNHIVAMTGDGVNDAPALKRANVGIAMGIKGSQATKDAAEMVLADDNFASIAQAVKEGRTIYDNLRKAILFILPTNGGEALILLLTVMLALEHLPITPVQILWVNMITAVTLALALAFEPPESGVMKRPPRDPGEPILSGHLIVRIVYVSALLAMVAMYLFFEILDGGAEIAVAQTVAVNTLVAGQATYLFNSRYIFLPSYTWSGLTGNRKVLLAITVLVVFQGAFTYLPLVQTWFGTAPVPPSMWPWILAGALAVFVVVEVEKAIVRQFRSPHEP